MVRAPTTWVSSHEEAESRGASLHRPPGSQSGPRWANQTVRGNMLLFLLLLWITLTRRLRYRTQLQSQSMPQCYSLSQVHVRVTASELLREQKCSKVLFHAHPESILLRLVCGGMAPP